MFASESKVAFPLRPSCDVDGTFVFRNSEETSSIQCFREQILLIKS